MPETQRQVEYRRFIDSKAWRKIKQRYKASNLPQSCASCGSSRRIELHHKTYDRFGGAELLTDLCPLCRSCRSCHRLLHKGRIVLAKSPKQFIKSIHTEEIDGRDFRVVVLEPRKKQR